MKPANFTAPPKRMRCPKCKGVQALVVDKRNNQGVDPEADWARRRRECATCGYRWSTVEIHQKWYDMLKKLSRKMKDDKKQSGNSSIGNPGGPREGGSLRSEGAPSKKEALERAIRKIERGS